MFNKTTGLIFIFFGSIMFLGAVYFMFFRSESATPQEDFIVLDQSSVVEEQKQEEKKAVLPKEVPVVKNEIKKEEVKKEVNSAPIDTSDDRKVLEQLAFNFAERFGTYSNQSDYANFLGLRVFMTEKMKNWVEKYTENLKKENGDSYIYHGITTRAFASQTLEKTENTSRVLVETKRLESFGSKENTAQKDQAIEIQFMKEGEAWKVSGAYWK